MSPWLARLIDGNSAYTPPSQWGAVRAKHGFDVSKGRTWSWNPKDDHDVNEISHALASPDAPYIMRTPSDIAGWPVQQIIPIPMSLNAVESVEYLMAWNEFRRKMNMSNHGMDKNSPLVAALRFRQKSSILKAGHIAEFAMDNVRSGRQVFIGCEFNDTMDVMESAFTKAGMPWVEYSGRNVANRERARESFQHGDAMIVLCTSVDGVSFHAGEIMEDGTMATGAERITILADVRNRVLSTKQQMGRCHRDGMNSICYMPYAEDTKDESVINVFARKMMNMNTMMNNDSDKDYINALMMNLSND